MRVYFDLCSEEWRLNEEKGAVIDNDVWEDWKQGMQLLLSKPAFANSWEKILEANPQNYYEEPFVEFVNQIICK